MKDIIFCGHLKLKFYTNILYTLVEHVSPKCLIFFKCLLLEKSQIKNYEYIYAIYTSIVKI